MKHLIDNSCLCGEWLGMGQIKYSIDELMNTNGSQLEEGKEILLKKIAV